jgi:hypothetical protein
MKKFNITEEEKINILEQHKNFKNILNEKYYEKSKKVILESELLTEQKNYTCTLRDSAKQKCNKIKSAYSTNTAFDGYYKNNCVIVMPDPPQNGVASKNANIFSFEPNTRDGNFMLYRGEFTNNQISNVSSQYYDWNCEAIKTEKLNAYKNMGGFMEKPADYDLNPNNYNRIQVQGSQDGYLYQSVTQKNYLSSDSNTYDNPDQKDYIEALTTGGYTVHPTVSQRSSMQKINFETVDPESKGLFPQGISDVYISRTLFTRDDKMCKTLIDDYWDQYLVGMPYKTGAMGFNMDKAKVQFCVSSHPDNKWPGLGTLGVGGGEKPLQDKVNTLRGVAGASYKGKSAPPNRGEDAPFKLK